MKTKTIKIVSSLYDPATLAMYLEKVCYLRTARKVGDIETVNMTQLGKLYDNRITITIEVLQESVQKLAQKQLEARPKSELGGVRAGTCECGNALILKNHGRWTGYFCPKCKAGGSFNN